MHEYLDGDISIEHEKELREHLQTCSACKKQFEELEKTIALVQSTSHIQAPPGFTEKVLKNLPKEKKNVSIKRWFGRHPFLTAAIIFLTLMTTSMVSSWEQKNEQFTVTKHPDIIIENNTAIVPEGVTITGDIVVENGDILIAGKVEGNVTVINGKVIEEKNGGESYLASAGEVTGDIEEIDQVFEWLWFQIKSTMQKILEH
ncbi:anti-sigma factor [Fervidibacillus halotolerans]|uniref:Anti-sigma-W factor RsiW n=2 Tax=Fervidibacillus halotolerans TaxID=2980027 RepID=A0A9E8RZK6_9BACI|nr:anti-sigma factor [Fervidibacillus halotolerans]WAA14011.1 anti-sigma factor [Fervidibacillus halotolerans]